MIYAANRQLVFLFGGQGAADVRLNDLWSWDGSLWRSIDKQLEWPAGQSDHALVYDASRQQGVLFGGRGGQGVLADTWLWNGYQWSKPPPSLSPSARWRHSLAYDAERQEVVLFGGQTTTTAEERGELQDTWVWDGAQWQQRQPATSPPPLAGHSLAYDAQRKEVVLWGGVDSSGQFSDTLWAWNGVTWSQLSVAGTRPAPRFAQALTTVQDQVILFGGVRKEFLSPDLLFADTWRWQNGAWTQLAKPAPFAHLHGSALAYEANGKFLAFGGTYGNALNAARQADTYRWQGDRWEKLALPNIPPGRSNHRLVRNHAGSQLLMFGGLGDGREVLGDTWLWDGSRWLTSTLSLQPPARQNYSLAYDSTANVWLLFGGSQDAEGTVDLADLWKFDGTGWQELPAATKPLARQAATLTYDPKRQRAVLFGGKHGDSYFQDLWEWHEGQWHNVTPAAIHPTPSARAWHSAHYSAELGGILIAGGAANQDFGDSWLWKGVNWQALITLPILPALDNLQISQDDAQQTLVAYGERSAISIDAQGAFYSYTVHKPISVTKPVATIHYLNPAVQLQVSDVITFAALGSSAADGDQIVAYAWTLDELPLSDQKEFTRAIRELPAGRHTIGLRVQDALGETSETVTRTIEIPEHGAVRSINFLPLVQR